MSNRLEKFVGRFSKHHPYLGYIIGGFLILVDNVGRAQIIKGMWPEIKSAWTSIHLVWPSHLLTWIGLGFLVIGVVSTFWPKSKAFVPLLSEEGSLAPKKASGRVFLPPKLTPSYLCDLARDKTAYQALKATEIYVGKWMRIAGAISDISSTLGHLTATLRFGPSTVVLFFEMDKWSDHLSVIPLGEKISAVGKIRSIESRFISLDCCELEDVN